MKTIKLVAVILSVAMLLCGCTPEGNTVLSTPEAVTVGEGQTSFEFSVIYDGTETPYIVRTDREFVGEALMDNGLIDGEPGAYGLYVKVVNGITLDYDTDGMYWAFYINGEYAMSGVDTTPITEGESYSFRAEK